jgi:hypothetical protein
VIDWFGATLSPLPDTYKRVIPAAGRSVGAVVLGYQLGTKEVHATPDYQPREKPAIGLDVIPDNPKDQVRAWAIVGPTPVAILEPMLVDAPAAGLHVSLELVGNKPAQHWIITTEPATSAGA